MPKGFFTQTLVVLTGGSVNLDELDLGNFKIVKRMEPAESWELGGPALLIDYRGEVNGFVSVDYVDRPWPDPMGDPQNETTLFATWGMGYFGPHTFPGALERAAQFGNPGRTSAEHTGFLRLRTSYAFGAAPDAPVMPRDCDPLDEITFLTGMAMDVLKHPSARAYFNPAAELIFNREMLAGIADECAAGGLIPIYLWMNRRRCDEGGRIFMDTVGLEQLDLPDLEIEYEEDVADAEEGHGFLLNLAVYLLENGPVIETGHTVGGPGGISFVAEPRDEARLTPPRRTLYLKPELA